MKKINKKGFTLTELLATIVILALVAVIATPAVIGVSNSIKKNMLESQKKLIMRAAVLAYEDALGDEDLKNGLVNQTCLLYESESYCNNYKLIGILELAKYGYIECEDCTYDEAKPTINGSGELVKHGKSCYENPQNGESMNYCEVKITENNGRITASWHSQTDACNWK